MGGMYLAGVLFHHNVLRFMSIVQVANDPKVASVMVLGQGSVWPRWPRVGDANRKLTQNYFCTESAHKYTVLTSWLDLTDTFFKKIKKKNLNATCSWVK